jgi:hypothetical protein
LSVFATTSTHEMKRKPKMPNLLLELQLVHAKQLLPSSLRRKRALQWLDLSQLHMVVFQKSPPPTANKYVAQYLQNQQASLEEIKRAELLKAASDSVDSVPVIELTPAAEKDEVSSTVSNAGSDPQAVPDDASIINESKAAEEQSSDNVDVVPQEDVKEPVVAEGLY